MDNKVDTKKNIDSTKILFISKDKFARTVYPVIAGVPTAIVILYFLDLGQAYQNLLKHLVSPIVTGVTSGFILHFMGLRK